MAEYYIFPRNIDKDVVGATCSPTHEEKIHVGAILYGRQEFFLNQKIDRLAYKGKLLINRICPQSCYVRWLLGIR